MAYEATWQNGTGADPIVVSLTSPSPTSGWILVACALSDSATAGHVDLTPSGWTAAHAALLSTNDGQAFRCWYKVSDGTETSVTFDGTSGGTKIAAVLGFSGRDTSTPLDVAVQTLESSTSSATHDISITPVTDGVDLVFFDGNDSTDIANETFTFSTLSGTTNAWTTRVDINDGWKKMGVGTTSQTTAGAITARLTTSGAEGAPGAALFALRPTGGGGGGSPTPLGMLMGIGP